MENNRVKNTGEPGHCVACDNDTADEKRRARSACSSAETVGRLNSQCFCISLKPGALKQALAEELGDGFGGDVGVNLGARLSDNVTVSKILDLIEERCPHLFSASPIFVSDSQTARMAQVVHAIEQVVAMPAFREEIFASAPDVVRHDTRGVKGVFFAYDFHLHEDQLGLIEVNTNAGGAMLNALLARAQHACCTVMGDIIHSKQTVLEFEENIIAMFVNEWRLSLAAAGEESPRALKTIAIVDEAPEQQFLYPEFLLFQQLFQAHGYTAIITAPTELTWHGGVLWHGNTAIDLVYNRLTDFLLEDVSNAALRAAYLANAIVLTPHPQAHALFADKRHLAIWSDRERLQALGVPEDIQAILLKNIPATEKVKLENAERLWAERRQLFFKPNAGFGGRAAYRGDKLTKRVWQEILEGNYIAQRIIAPGQRVMGSSSEPAQLKFDLRVYTYDGTVQWIAARTYQGQTTNFRTPGGGFAPVYSIADTLLNSNVAEIANFLKSQADHAC